MFEKKLKAGLKKCPVHKFETNYRKVSGNYFQCEKCKGFVELDSEEKVIKFSKAYVRA